MEENDKMQINCLEYHSLPIFQWEEWKSNLFICFMSVAFAVSLCGQGMIIFYIKRHSPVERPINRMYLIDQV